MWLYTLFILCTTLQASTCKLMRNIKSHNGYLSNANDTITPRDLFARQSCDPGYGLCDTGSCCPSDSQCCGYGCAPGNAVCCGVEGNCPSGNTCCDYNCAPPGYGERSLSYDRIRKHELTYMLLESRLLRYRIRSTVRRRLLF